MNHREAELNDAEYSCAYCGEINTTFVAPSQGNSYSYIEDCQVCSQFAEYSL